jgi:hypothetical protein
MGLDITIGNRIETTSDEDGKPLSVVRMVELAEAPNFPGDTWTRNRNTRDMTYAAWEAFDRATGLSSVFGLDVTRKALHPLAPKDLESIRDARLCWQDQHPDATPMLGNECAPYDAHLARLLWFEWWMDWALKNCEKPAIYCTV